MPRAQLLLLETSGPKLISCSPNLLASAGIAHLLFCMGHFVCSFRCQLSTTNMQGTFAPTALSPAQHYHHNTADMTLESAGKFGDVAS